MNGKKTRFAPGLRIAKRAVPAVSNQKQSAIQGPSVDAADSDNVSAPASGLGTQLGTGPAELFDENQVVINGTSIRNEHTCYSSVSGAASQVVVTISKSVKEASRDREGNTAGTNLEITNASCLENNDGDGPESDVFFSANSDFHIGNSDPIIKAESAKDSNTGSEIDSTAPSSPNSLSEKGQRARRALRSSGYGTGSGESGQETSKESVSYSQDKNGESSIFEEERGEEATSASHQLSAISETGLLDSDQRSQHGVNASYSTKSSSGESNGSTLFISKSLFSLDYPESHLRMNIDNTGVKCVVSSVPEHNPQPDSNTELKRVANQEAQVSTQKNDVGHKEKPKLVYSSVNPAFSQITDGNVDVNHNRPQNYQTQLHNVDNQRTKHRNPARSTGQSTYKNGLKSDLSRSLRHQTVFPFSTDGQDSVEYFPGFESMSLGFEVNSLSFDMTKQLLEQSGRCMDWPCENHHCQLIKMSLNYLRDPMVKVEHLNRFHRLLLQSMLDHIKTCSDLLGPMRCPFFWCVESSQDEVPSVEVDMFKVMKKKVEGFVETFLQGLHLDSEPIFTKLDDKLSFSSFPVPGRDLQFLCAMPNTSRAFLAESKFGRWVISKIPEPEEYETTEKLFKKLRQLRHPSIVHHLWLAHFPRTNFILVCHQFLGCSLHEYLEHSPLDPLSVVPIMQQLVAVTQKLHSRGILYLNWSSTHVLFDVMPVLAGQMQIKLCDFSASVIEDEYDEGQLCLMLPQHLFPPELLDHCKVTQASDVWGLGCLLLELTTRKPIWHQLRHIPVDQLKTKMKENLSPPIDLPQVYEAFQRVISSCLTGNSLGRPSLNELSKKLEQIVVSPLIRKSNAEL